MSVLYCQSPALFWCALALIVCFFVRRGAHRVRAVLDLVLGLLCVVGGVALYYLGMYNNAFTIRDFWYIRTAGWIGLAVVVLVTVWQVVKATRRSMSARRPPARQSGTKRPGRRSWRTPGPGPIPPGRRTPRPPPGGGKCVRRRGRPGERVRKKRVCCGTPVCPRQKGFLTS